VPLFSPRSATLLSDEARDAAAPLLLAFLSDAVREAWSGPVHAATVAARADSAALASAVARLVTKTPGA
jgi:uroporphyrinogen-III synthase